MRLTEEQATEQLCNLISPLIDLPVQWQPLNSVTDDYNVLEWIRHPQNDWCSGKKQDFEYLLGKAKDYETGKYSLTVLSVLGVAVKGRS